MYTQCFLFIHEVRNDFNIYVSFQQTSVVRLGYKFFFLFQFSIKQVHISFLLPNFDLSKLTYVCNYVWNYGRYYLVV